MLIGHKVQGQSRGLQGQGQDLSPFLHFWAYKLLYSGLLSSAENLQTAERKLHILQQGLGF